MTQRKTKVCTKCGIEKDVDEFHFRHKSTDRVGKKGEYSRLRRGNCKQCQNKQTKEHMVEYYPKNRERMKAKATEWRKNNKDRFQKWQTEYARHKRHTDPVYKLACAMRGHARRYVSFCKRLHKGEDISRARTPEQLGCTYQELKEHLESLFQPGMTWDNHSYYGWHIDHIIPLSKGGTNHYTNLQPLWAKDNLNKGGSYEPEER